MAEMSMQEAVQQSQQSEQQSNISLISKELDKFGGFNAIRRLIPEIADLDPDKKASRTIFLEEGQYAEKRKYLINEIDGWLKLLEGDKDNAADYYNLGMEQELGYQKLFSENITRALEATKTLETSYRTLNSFFVNANSNKINNLRIINIKKDVFDGDTSDLSQEIDKVLKRGYDQLSLKHNYSMLVIPGHVIPNSAALRKWAQIAHKYKVLLITDHKRENSVEDLIENTKNYKDSDICLTNVVMTCNWIVGREKEELSTNEAKSDDKAFFIPPSGALAGKLHDEALVISQGANGKKFGTLNEVTGVELNLMKSEIAELMDNQMIPIVFSEGRVMAFNNSTLYTGDNRYFTEYPCIRVLEWIDKVIMNYTSEISGQNWDSIHSPTELRTKIQNFLDPYKGFGNLIQNYSMDDPIQDEDTGVVSINIRVKLFTAAKNFSIKVSANQRKQEKSSENS